MKDGNSLKRRCRKCGALRPLADFLGDRGRFCVKCRREKVRENSAMQRAKDPEKWKAYIRGYNQTHREQILQKRREYYASHREQFSATRRKYYDSHHRKEVAVRWSEEHGRAMVYNGKRVSVYWSEAMVEKLKRIYPWCSNKDCAIEMGLPMYTVRNKAASLNLRKSPAYISAIRKEGARIRNIIAAARRETRNAEGEESKPPETA